MIKRQKESYSEPQRNDTLFIKLIFSFLSLQEDFTPNDSTIRIYKMI